MSLVGVCLFLVGLMLVAVQSASAPHRGRSVWALILMVPGVLMLAPLSALNIPTIRHFRRLLARRLLPECVE